MWYRCAWTVALDQLRGSFLSVHLQAIYRLLCQLLCENCANVPLWGTYVMTHEEGIAHRRAEHHIWREAFSQMLARTAEGETQIKSLICISLARPRVQCFCTCHMLNPGQRPGQVGIFIPRCTPHSGRCEQ